jgi:hypothetical protein
MKRNGFVRAVVSAHPAAFQQEPLRITRIFSVKSKGGFFHAKKSSQPKSVQDAVLPGILAAGGG